MNKGFSVIPVNVSVNRVRPTVIIFQWDILWSCSSSTNDEVLRYQVQYLRESNSAGFHLQGGA